MYSEGYHISLLDGVVPKDRDKVVLVNCRDTCGTYNRLPTFGKEHRVANGEYHLNICRDVYVYHIRSHDQEKGILITSIAPISFVDSIHAVCVKQGSSSVTTCTPKPISSIINVPIKKRKKHSITINIIST